MLHRFFQIKNKKKHTLNALTNISFKSLARFLSSKKEMNISSNITQIILSFVNLKKKHDILISKSRVILEGVFVSY
jgi:hypothetical protein